MVQAVFHFFDKNYVDPINYVTDAKASEVCDNLSLLQANTSSGKQIVFDQTMLQNIHQAFEREQKILYIVEDAISNQDSHAPIEQVLRSAHTAYYSATAKAIIYGYLTTKIHISEETVMKLKNAQTPFGVPQAIANTTAETSIQVNTDNISPSALEQLVLAGNPTWTMKFANLIRKSMTNPLGYLTDSKASTIAESALSFHPTHRNKKEFNCSLPLHKALLHQSFERQIRLLDLIESCLKSNNHEALLTLRQKTNTGYFSSNANSVVSAYLQFATQRNSTDAHVRKTTTENSLKTSDSPVG